MAEDHSRPARAPAGLGKAGRALWRATAGAHWLAATDLPALASLARLADVRAELEAAIARDGVVLTEPIVTPTGQVVGERVVAHPAVSELCRVDRQSAAAYAALGFTAKARADLAIDGAPGERLRAEIDRFLSTKYEKDRP